MTELFGLSDVSLSHVQAVLLHTLWQGALMSAAVFLALQRVPAGRANLRYGVAVTGLAGIVLLALVSWCAFEYPLGAAGQTPVAAAGVVSGVTVPVHGADAASPGLMAAASGTASSHRVSHYLVWAWLAGASLMLLRVLWLMRGASNLHRRCRTLDDPRVVALLDEVKAALGLSRRVAVLVSDGLASPVAMGLLWPAVLMPASMSTGLTPDQLRAVLAHEVAHIRRYDYLINFIQLIVEGLLYFNPAVWWLSRQIRIEREACCDALAARATGGALDYADALAHVARGLRPSVTLAAAAQGFGAEERPDSLLDRIRRLLLPGYHPRLRLRWYGVTAGLLVTLGVFFGLYQGSALSVAMAGRLFTDQERIEVMSQLRQDFDTRWTEDDEDREQVEVSGSLVTGDGEPLPESPDRHVEVLSATRNATVFSSLPVKEMRFHGEVDEADEIFITSEIPGYAPVVVGPLHGDAMHPIEKVELHLKPSTPWVIHFVDPGGNPVVGAKVTGGYKYVKNAWSWSLRMTSDAQGEIRVDQAEKPLPVALRVKAEGFQPAEADPLPTPTGEIYEWVLQPDRPVEGIVVDLATGQPIEDALVAMLWEEGRGFRDGVNGEFLARTGQDGRFVLRGLNRAREYYFLVRAANHGSEVVNFAVDAETPLRVALGQRYVSGVIRGDLSLLKQRGDRPVISISMALDLPGQSYRQSAIDWPVSVAQGEGRFIINGLRAGNLYIEAGTKRVRVAVDKPVEDLVIDLNEAPAKTERSLVMRFHAPDGAPAATGTIGISVFNDVGNSFPMARDVAVVNGAAETTVEVPARCLIYGDGLAGYLITPRPKDDGASPLCEWEVPAGSTPYVIDLPLERAGAIRGQVLRADGTPAVAASVSVSLPPETQVRWPDDYSCSFRCSNPVCNAQGAFAALPLPLDTTIKVTVSEGFSICVEEIQLTGAEPVVNRTFRLPEGVDVPVRVLKPDGAPMAGVVLTVSYPGGAHTGLQTDSDGRCILHNVDPREEYWVCAEPAGRYQHTQIALATDGSENIIRLDDGWTAAGRVLLSGSDAPVPNYPVSAYLVSEFPRPLVYRVKALTDSEGRFRFSDLCPGTFYIGPDWDRFSVAFEFDTPDQDRRFIAGQSDPIVIHVRPRDASGQ